MRCRKRSHNSGRRSNKSRPNLSMLPHPNFKVQKYYQNKSKFNGIFSGNNLSKIKGGACIIKLDEYESIGTHWIALYVNAENVTNIDSFGVKHIPKEFTKFIGN